jgi:acyl dehydratase
MKLQTRAGAIGIQARSSGVTVVVKGETTTDSGEPVVDQYMTSFVRGASGVESQGEEAPPHSFPEELRGTDPEAVVVQTFDEDQTFRYSEASGDPMPIHLDDDLAKAMGLPGIIIHGLCTMAFTSRAVIQTACPEDPSKLRRLAVRFSKPVQPKQSITTTIYSSGHGSHAHETASDDGGVVIKDGLAEVA